MQLATANKVYGPKSKNFHPVKKGWDSLHHPRK